MPPQAVLQPHCMNGTRHSYLLCSQFLPSLLPLLHHICTACMDSQLQSVSWYFETSQLQQITSGLKQMSISLLPTLHTSHQTTKILSPPPPQKKKKISPNTNFHKTKHTQTSNTKFSKNQSLPYCYHCWGTTTSGTEHC